MGGDDCTPYNWENNATNLGPHAPVNNNLSFDTQAGTPDTDQPGEAMVSRIKASHALGAAALITVPILDYVAADKKGIVTETATATSKRWVQNKATKESGALLMKPDTLDGVVYQDEFVNFIEQTFHPALAEGKKIFYSLDNEPSSWSSTHALLHPTKATYAEVADRTRRFGIMIKRLAPDSLVFGPADGGLHALVTLHGASDEGSREFVDFYLDTAKELQDTEKKRIIDVLDIHWYPEVQVKGKYLVDSNAVREKQNPNPSKEEIEAWVQMPRSLWDPVYIEGSSVTEDLYGKSRPIRLIPWLKEKIAARYPGTMIAISEYNYGDGSHLAHALATADVLGIFGREGLFAANHLSLDYPSPNYLPGAFAMYLDYDGKGSAVGDLSLKIDNPDVARLSLYAMKNTKDPNVLHVVAINKADTETPLNFTLGVSDYKTVKSYRLTSVNIRPQSANTATIGTDFLSDRLPPLSVTTYEVRK